MISSGKKFNNMSRASNPFSILSGRLKDGKVDTVYRSDWSEDVYISDAKEKETVRRSFDSRKVIFIGFGLIFFLVVLMSKIAWLQIARGEYYRSMAEGNRVRIQRIEPKRGVVYDSMHRALVRNKANFLLYFVPADLPEDEPELGGILDEIAAIIGDISKEEIRETLEKVEKYSLESFQPLFIYDNIEYEKAMELYLKSSNWPGVMLTNKSNREYLISGESFTVEGEKEERYHTSMSHIIGYTGKINNEELKSFGDGYLPIDYIGKMGIEYFWENELKGKSGKKQIEVDALGKEKKIIGQEAAEDGHNLVLSVDAEVQLKLEEIILAHLAKLKLTKATAIIMNPSNGEIISMVSLPSYNNNLFARGISQEEYKYLIEHPDKPLFNRTISGEYPSGSTIKMVMAAAALQEGVITEHTSFNSVGGITVGQWSFPDWKAGGHGITDVRKAIAQSVNTFFYYIGGGHDDFRGLGVDRIVKYGELFGLGEQTGIDLAGEKRGFLPTSKWKLETKGEQWYIGDTYHLAIGQGDLLVTPLQVALYTSVFANGGALYRPHLIKQILTSDDVLLGDITTEPVRNNFIDSYNMEIVRQGMRKTVTEGSARSLSVLPIEVAGKTGTAQWSSKKDPHAWFTGFAPYNNPEIVFSILVEEGAEGSTVAVPIAKDFLEWYFGAYKEKKNN